MSSVPINPIIPGFSPDPSTVKVDGMYFLVNSTFHLFPGLPVYVSRDLLCWRQIGNVIHRKCQLSLAKSDTRFGSLPDAEDVMLVTGGLYAPTIRHHGGVFYVICTNIIHEGKEDIPQNFIVSTKDIWSGEWGDLVYFDFQGIDPSLLFDDDGKVYVQGSRAPGPMTRIHNFEIDLKSGAKLSEERLIWEGTGGIYPEGPHVYKRNGWYYLLISEGGTHEGHMITIARAETIWGPYEACLSNPVLTARGTDEYIRYTGHCDAFEDDEGQWWGTCLGVRKDPGGRYIMGRETFLTRATWDNDWLSFELVKSNPASLVRKEGAEALSAVPGIDFLYIRDAIFANYQFDGTSITLNASNIDLSHREGSPTFVSKRQRFLSGSTEAIVKDVTQSWGPFKLQAGIAVYKDEHRYARIFYDASDESVVFELLNNAKRLSRTARAKLQSIPSSLALRLEYTEQQYAFSYSVMESYVDDWNQVAVADTLDLTGPDFVGPVCGVFAVAKKEGIKVRFDRVKVE